METPFAMNGSLTSDLAVMLAIRNHCWHCKSMAIQINIRDVPERVRDELAARAALQGKSMQEFLRAELERLAERPSIDAWLQQVRARKRTTQTRVSARQILENRNSDRR
jgi:antitoxin FitA